MATTAITIEAAALHLFLSLSPSQLKEKRKRWMATTAITIKATKAQTKTKQLKKLKKIKNS